MKKIFVIGGGASGLMAAIKAACEQTEVTILEKSSKLGKKILASGNGKCNFSNLNVNPNSYNNPEFVDKVLANFSVNDTLEFFNNKGLLYTYDEEHRVYPMSFSAESVLNILVKECKRLGVTVYLDTKVLSINKTKDNFVIECEKENFYADSVIIATGSYAGQKSTDKSYNILSKSKHNITSLSPALVPLKTPRSQVKGISGVRVKANVTLFYNNNKIHSERGEVLFKDEGLSGIVIYNMSVYIARSKKQNYKISIDIAPDLRIKDLYSRFFNLDLSIDDFLNGLFNSKISRKVIRDAGTSLEDVVKYIKAMEFDITGSYDYSFAQIVSGGIKVCEIDNTTLESKLIENLYFSGEIMDIDGVCGGYNLQWAWSSGAVAGKSSSSKL